MRELLSNISLFVGQLYADKSLALCARDLLCFTTELQPVIYYSTIHCARADLFLNSRHQMINMIIQCTSYRLMINVVSLYNVRDI